MDIAAAASAASQISNAQRAQQISIASLRQVRQQGATLANLIAQAVAPAQSSAATAPTEVPSSGAGQGLQFQPGQTPPNPNLPRGSLVNILA
jgi:hypothetical protein